MSLSTVFNGSRYSLALFINLFSSFDSSLKYKSPQSLNAPLIASI
nr:MAG TPA: hypothetical protein [Caudoviricetes sp.]